MITLALGLALLGPGCTSLYRRTRAEYPTDPAAETSLRTDEAAKAENAVRKAAEHLLEDLQKSESTPTILSDFDRLEAAAFDFERRTLAAKDALKISGKESPEMERLGAEAQSWLNYARVDRNMDASQQVQNLRALIAKPAGK